MDIEIQLAVAMAAVQKLCEAMNDTPEFNRRAAAVAKTHFETAFLWVANGTGEPLIDGQ